MHPLAPGVRQTGHGARSDKGGVTSGRKYDIVYLHSTVAMKFKSAEPFRMDVVGDEDCEPVDTGISLKFIRGTNGISHGQNQSSHGILPFSSLTSPRLRTSQFQSSRIEPRELVELDAYF